MKGRVVQFPRRGRPARWVPVDEPSRSSLGRSLLSHFRIPVLWLLGVVRVLLFLVMFWLRLPVTMVCSFVSVATLLAWLFSLYAWPDKTEMVWGFGMTSLVAFAIGWVYDYILMALSPQELVNTI